MTNLNVTYESMTSVANRLLHGKEELESKLQELRGIVNDLTSNGFTTTRASGAFSASYEQFTVGATQTIGGLQAMSNFLSSAAETLRATDEQLANSISL